MILVQKELQSNIHEAFRENCSRENFIHVKALDQDISINYQSLAIFSPYFRSLISSAPCCTEPTLFLPEFSVSSVTSFLSLVTHGTTEDSIRSPGEAAEIIKVAKAFDIDASDYSVVVQEDNFPYSKKGTNQPKVVSTLEGTETERIVKEEPCIEEPDEFYDKGKDEALLTEELDMEGNQSKQNITNKKDEYVMQNVSLSQADASFSSKDGESTVMRCQICSVSHTKLSVLHIHYIHAHFMQEARSEFRSFASEKTCDLCGKECKTSQQLFVHIGVKHKKVNMLLARHGYKEHIKPKRNIREAELLQTESSSRVDDPLISSKAVDISKSDTEGCESSDKKLNTCQLCDKSIVGLSFLWQHYTTSHFTKDIKQSYGSLMDFENLKCKLCDKKMKQRQGLLTHMGAVHHKVNEVLVKYGLTPLEIKTQNMTDQVWTFPPNQDVQGIGKD